MPLYTSDWHIHSEASYDAELTVPELLKGTGQQGIAHFGLADHVNYPSWIHYLHESRELWEKYRRPGFHLGVELTTISGLMERYDREAGTLDGFVHPGGPVPDPVALPLTAEELRECGVEYVVGAAHWTLNVPDEWDLVIEDFYRQNMYLACDPRVDIVGHPWSMGGERTDKNGHKTRMTELTIVPRAMLDEFIAALRQHNKYMEINITSMYHPYRSEEFKRQYSEFARRAFEAGVKITIGSDEHGHEDGIYVDRREWIEPYLREVGFAPGDITGVLEPVHTF